METTFGDTKTSQHRLSWYVSKKLARLSLNATFVKVVLYTVLIFLALYAFTSWWNKHMEQQIVAKQLVNLTLYKNINGFTPVHKNY